MNDEAAPFIQDVSRQPKPLEFGDSFWSAPVLWRFWVRLKLSVRSADASSACWERHQIRADGASTLLTTSRLTDSFNRTRRFFNAHLPQRGEKIPSNS